MVIWTDHLTMLIWSDHGHLICHGHLALQTNFYWLIVGVLPSLRLLDHVLEVVLRPPRFKRLKQGYRSGSFRSWRLRLSSGSIFISSSVLKA
jgi:hypothetical protein